MRGAHAALSPNLGAPATPAPWHTWQTLSYVALPSALAAPFAGAGGIAAATTGAAAEAAAGAAAAGAGALGSTSTFATGAMRLATAAGDIEGSSFRVREP